MAGVNIACHAWLHDHKFEFNNAQIIDNTLIVAHCISDNANKNAIRIGPSNTGKKNTLYTYFQNYLYWRNCQLDFVTMSYCYRQCSAVRSVIDIIDD